MPKFKRIQFLILSIFVISLSNSTVAGVNDKSNRKTENEKAAYSVYNSFEELLEANDAKYFKPVRISPVGNKKNPIYHGFFFYNCSHYELYQFDPTGRFMLGMRIFIEGRKVQADDKGEIGFFDLQHKNKWTKIGETTAWNWQQGCRLQWIPGSSEEIIWNDCSDDGKTLVSRIYNINTKKTRTLPIPIPVSNGFHLYSCNKN